MNNSHSKQYLLGLYKAVLEDCRGTFPRLRKELERDFKRLSSLVETRGLRVLTLDLPAVGKEFDFSLHTGHLTLTSTYLTSRRKKSSPIPRLFGSLVMCVFDERGVLRNDSDIEAIRFLRQLFLLAKKWKAPCDESYTFKEVREFFRVDQELRLPTLNWGDTVLSDYEPSKLRFVGDYVIGEGLQQGILPGFDPKEDKLMQAYGVDALGRVRLLGILQQVADIMSTTLGEFQAENMLAKHGPGVVSDLAKSVSKYEFPIWSDRLEQVFPSAQFAFANYGLWVDYVNAWMEANRSHLIEEDKEFFESLKKAKSPYSFTVRRFEESQRFLCMEMWSKLIAVPKTQKGPRLIAAEPTAHQWCQQIIQKFLHDRVERSWIGDGIDFRDQSKNQRAALAASVDSSMSTIDLKAASDRMSCWVVERLFRRNPSLLKALHASRTLIIRNPIDKKSSQFYELRKFSTMGSAVTFPVQSLCFLTVALAAAHYVGGIKPSIRSCRFFASRTRVFGDDIIVATKFTECTLYLLQHLGFEVNTSKTYSGPSSRFRESCGVEAYNGVDVTPCYALMVPRQSAPQSLVSNVAAAHNFFKKKLMAAAEFIQRTTTKAGLTDLPLVKSGSGVFGWPSVFGFDYSHLRSRWNADLQRREYLARSYICRVTRAADRGSSRLLQYFTEAPKPDVDWESGVVVEGAAVTRPRWVAEEA